MICPVRPRRVLQVAGLRVAYGGNALDLERLSLRQGRCWAWSAPTVPASPRSSTRSPGWSRGTPRVSGAVRLDGVGMSALPAHRRARAGLLLVPGKLVFERRREPDRARRRARCAGSGIRDREEVFELFPRLRERRGHLGSQLSGGERQMLGVEQMLMLSPHVLMLDRPSIGLAPRLVSAVLETMLAGKGNPAGRAERARRHPEVVYLVLLERGRVIVEGTASRCATCIAEEPYLGGGHG